MDKKYEYTCRYVDHDIKITGKMDDPAWEGAENIDFYVPVTLAKPISRTEAKILWSENHIYVGFKAYDKDIWSYFTEHDSQTCLEDCLEFFFKPSEAQDSYYNFEINALGTVYDALNLKRGAGERRWAMWNCENLQVAVHIDGEINNPSVVDNYWMLEIAVPFDSLPTLERKRPSDGDILRYHLARYDYSIHLPEGVELSSCAPFTKVDFHRYEDWATLKFAR